MKKVVGFTVFNHYFKFAFVRNPYDRAVSEFVYIRSRPDLLKYLGMSQADSFTKFLQLILHREHTHWRPQVDFITDERQNQIVDFVGRVESFDNDFKVVCREIGLAFPSSPLPNANAGARGPYRDYYTWQDRRILKRIYREDFERFNYRF